MPLINLVIVLIVVGVLLWIVNTYIPMDRKIKNILNIVWSLWSCSGYCRCSACWDRWTAYVSAAEADRNFKAPVGGV